MALYLALNNQMEITVTISAFFTNFLCLLGYLYPLSLKTLFIYLLAFWFDIRNNIAFPSEFIKIIFIYNWKVNSRCLFSVSFGLSIIIPFNKLRTKMVIALLWTSPQFLQLILQLFFASHQVYSDSPMSFAEYM